MAYRDFIEDSRDAASQHVLLQQRQLERGDAVAKLRLAGLVCKNRARREPPLSFFPHSRACVTKCIEKHSPGKCLNCWRYIFACGLLLTISTSIICLEHLTLLCTETQCEYCI